MGGVEVVEGRRGGALAVGEKMRKGAKGPPCCDQLVFCGYEYGGNSVIWCDHCVSLCASLCIVVLSFALLALFPIFLLIPTCPAVYCYVRRVYHLPRVRNVSYTADVRPHPRPHFPTSPHPQSHFFSRSPLLSPSIPTSLYPRYRLHQTTLDMVDDEEERHRRLVELNVVEQCLNLYKTGVVQRKRVKTYQDKDAAFAYPRIHALCFDPGDGLLNKLRINFKRQIESYKHIYDLYEIPDEASLGGGGGDGDGPDGEVLRHFMLKKDGCERAGGEGGAEGAGEGAGAGAAVGAGETDEKA